MAEITRDSVAELLANLPDRISDVIKPWADSAPDHLALVEASGTWTYQQLERLQPDLRAVDHPVLAPVHSAARRPASAWVAGQRPRECGSLRGVL